MNIKLEDLSGPLQKHLVEKHMKNLFSWCIEQLNDQYELDPKYAFIEDRIDAVRNSESAYLKKHNMEYYMGYTRAFGLDCETFYRRLYKLCFNELMEDDYVLCEKIVKKQPSVEYREVG